MGIACPKCKSALEIPDDKLRYCCYCGHTIPFYIIKSTLVENLQKEIGDTSFRKNISYFILVVIISASVTYIWTMKTASFHEILAISALTVSLIYFGIVTPRRQLVSYKKDLYHIEHRN